MSEVTELHIPAKPTTVPQLWPETLDGLSLDFTSFDVLHYGTRYNEKCPRGSTGHTRNLRLLSADGNGVYVFSIEDDYTPFVLAGGELHYTLDVHSRTYMVSTSPDHFFDEEEYLETEETDRTVAIFKFGGGGWLR